jgi:hypothetical protein
VSVNGKEVMSVAVSHLLEPSRGMTGISAEVEAGGFWIIEDSEGFSVVR